MAYQILSAEQAGITIRRRNRIDWPMADLEIGQSFLLPMTNGRDSQGHHEDSIRALVSKFNKKLHRRFGCRKVEAGVLVVRIE
jgi:hypothetical protein